MGNRTKTVLPSIPVPLHRSERDFLRAAKTPIGFLIGGTMGVAGATGAALASILFYEFCHCIHHLHYTPRSRFLRRIKQLHLLHHFHNENGNYGITNTFWDRMIGTYCGSAGDVPGSATVFNLGYTEEECARDPWVARMSESKR